MSLTCHEEIGRVGRGCYEDASDLSAASRACRARGSWRTTRHTDKRAALYTAADCRPTNQVSAWQAELGSRLTRLTEEDRSATTDNEQTDRQTYILITILHTYPRGGGRNNNTWVDIAQYGVGTFSGIRRSSTNNN